MMMSYWVNFATKGDPNGKGLIIWKPYDRDAEAYMEFGDSVEVRNHLLKGQLDFMERFQKQR